MTKPPIPIAVAVVEHDGRFLVGRRPEGVALAGCWEFPGGKIEAGETPNEAAVRECREETGLAVEVVGEYPSCEHVYAHGVVRLNFLACRVGEPSTPREPFRWVARQELAELTFPEANRELLALLLATTVVGK